MNDNENPNIEDKFVSLQQTQQQSWEGIDCLVPKVPYLTCT